MEHHILPLMIEQNSNMVSKISLKVHLGLASKLCFDLDFNFAIMLDLPFHFTELLVLAL
jgi:hypothetical protein